MPARVVESQQVAGLHVTQWRGTGTSVRGFPGLGSGGKHHGARPFLSPKVVEEWGGRLPTLTAERMLYAPEVEQAVGR